MNTLTADKDERKDIPLATGCLDYFPAALAEVARLSKAANDKHNPGEPMHHSRGKSNDHADCLMRHLIDRGKVDPDDGFSHTVKVAWRALALLQEELEAAGAPLARGAKLPDAPPEVSLEGLKTGDWVVCTNSNGFFVKGAFYQIEDVDGCMPECKLIRGYAITGKNFAPAKTEPNK